MRLVLTLDAKTAGFREPAALLVEAMTTLSQGFEACQYPLKNTALNVAKEPHFASRAIGFSQQSDTSGQHEPRTDKCHFPV